MQLSTRIVLPLVGAFVLLAVTAVHQSAGQVARNENGEIGRFQIVVHPNVGKFQYLLDTATGDVWTVKDFMGMSGETKFTAWEKMGKIDTLDNATFEGTFKANRGIQA